MQRGQLLYDGLWRCLCPSFDQLALRTAIQRQGLSLPGARTTGWRQNVARARVRPVQVRCYETSSSFASTGSVSNPDLSQAPSQTDSRPGEAQRGDDDGGIYLDVKSRSWKDRLLSPEVPSEEALKASTVDEIMAALAWLREVKRERPVSGQEVDQHQRIVQLVQHLLRVENRPITPLIYECMMDAMADPRGSVDGLRRLLDDMVEQGMKPTAEFCNGALRALMNHPDYVMRMEILGIMQEYWFTIDTPVKQTVVVGLLRDEQYELAYARLTEMIEQGAKLDTWVYDIFILVFGRHGFLDEMLQLLYRRKNIGGGSSNDPIVISLAYYALDVCSQAYHHAGTLFGWLSVVQNHLVQPADGILENVLGTAARNADARLASEALAIISERMRAQSHHYEAVVEAFVGSGDLAAAIRTLCIMEDGGLRIGRSQTRRLHAILRSRSELLDGAEAAVREAAGARPVPRAAAAAIIEALAQTHGSARALPLYRDLPKLCGVEPPNARMIQTLVIHSADEATAKFFAKEYADQISESEDPKQTNLSLSALITKCAEAGEMDLAFRFTKQALAGGITRSSRLSPRWIYVLVEQAMAREDGRVWPVVDELLSTGNEDMTRTVRRMLQQKRISKLASQWKAGTSMTAP
ncbi:hypothetical protein M419DRAFT_24835 [Trichoderma reesei RUT C-30]|nr:hypothetical protein M419DRAFT_24835 [Trichoderma reesei RUT C-30]